jgi:hypothetical protein
MKPKKKWNIYVVTGIFIIVASLGTATMSGESIIYSFIFALLGGGLWAYGFNKAKKD